MSRMLNINATQEDVIATCAKRNVRITAIETLQSGGTRVVTSTGLESALISKIYGSKVIPGMVQRVPSRLRTA